jgi:hypothetical protein
MKKSTKATAKSKRAKPIKVASGFQEDKSPPTGGHIFVGGMVPAMMKATEANKARKH